MNSFPNVKRIVYSTCSIYPEENERVVTNAVKTSRTKWRVQDVKEMLKGQWNNFGSGMYGTIGTRCLYAKSDSDLTTGFFLAILDKDQKDETKYSAIQEKSNHENNDNEIVNTDINKVRKNKKKDSSENKPVESVEENIDYIISKKEKKKRKKFETEVENEHAIENYSNKKKRELDTEDISIEVTTKLNDEMFVKKKKSKSNESCTDTVASDIITETCNDVLEVKTKKKKRKKDIEN